MDEKPALDRRYFDFGRTHPDKTDLGPENMERLRSGEVLTIVDEAGRPRRTLLLDTWNEFRAAEVENPGSAMLFMFFGVPVSFYASPEFRARFEEIVWGRVPPTERLYVPPLAPAN